MSRQPYPLYRLEVTVYSFWLVCAAISTGAHIVVRYILDTARRLIR